MLSNMTVLTDNLLAYESVLRIEYIERGTEEIIASAIRKLENKYAIKLVGTTLGEASRTNTHVAKIVETLLKQVLDCSKTTSFIFMCGMFNHNLPITLGAVKYLGLGKEALQLMLRYFQNSDEYSITQDTVPQIIAGLDGINMGTTKRLFVIMLVLDRLGIREGAAIIAQLLYYGTLWEDKNDITRR